MIINNSPNCGRIYLYHSFPLAFSRGLQLNPIEGCSQRDFKFKVTGLLFTNKVKTLKHECKLSQTNWISLWIINSAKLASTASVYDIHVNT